MVFVNRFATLDEAVLWAIALHGRIEHDPSPTAFWPWKVITATL